MQIEVKNIAKISHAAVEVEGITVLAGYNSSGKSTVSRSLMTMGSLALHMTKLMDISRVKSVLELVGRFYSDMQVAFDLFANLYYIDDQIWKPLLSKDFWSQPTEFINWCVDNFTSDKSRPLLGYMSRLTPSRVKEIKDCWGKFSEQILLRLSEKDSKHARSVAEDVFSNAFADQIKPLGKLSRMSSIDLSDKSGALHVKFGVKGGIKCSSSGALAISSLFYIEPLNQLDLFSNLMMKQRHLRNDIDRYAALEYCYYNVMNYDKPAPMTMEEKRQWRRP